MTFQPLGEFQQQLSGGRTALLHGILICLISPSPWMPTQGLWQFCCPTSEHGAKGLELESGTLFLPKGSLLGHMESLHQLPSSQCSQCQWPALTLWS